MQGELECEGRVRFGNLPWDISERLAQFSGNWLEYAPEENAIIVRHVQPVGCPAVSAVPCELISIMDSIPLELRDSMPGGTLYVKDRSGQLLRLLVTRGEVRIQWPHLDYSRSNSTDLETALASLNPREARIKGWARFAGSPERATELQAFVDQFEGLYPEGDMPSECEQDLVYLQFKDVNVGPRELIGKLVQMAHPPQSLQGELDVSSFAPGSLDRCFRVRIADGSVEVVRPSLWQKE
jgi:hypothetical protein